VPQDADDHALVAYAQKLMALREGIEEEMRPYIASQESKSVQPE
jgi:hypothetical protein